MIGHSREVLANLGIDIWVSRGAVSQKLPHSSIWRDENTAENILDFKVDHSEISDIELLNDPITSFETEPLLVKKEHKIEEDVKPIVVESEDIRPAIQLESFNIQALVLPYIVILIEGTNITANQQLLWANIQRGIHAEFTELNWPFALPDLQDGYGVDNYIQGFLDVISMEKNILALGEIPHYKKSNIMQLASLQDMIDEPLLKKRLWKFIQNKGLE